MGIFSDIPAQAVQDSEARLGALLRMKAIQGGWPLTTARTLKVYGEGTDLIVGASPEAEDLEYGDGENIPSPIIRQFANRRGPIEEELLRAAGDRLKGIL